MQCNIDYINDSDNSGLVRYSSGGVCRPSVLISQFSKAFHSAQIPGFYWDQLYIKKAGNHQLVF